MQSSPLEAHHAQIAIDRRTRNRVRYHISTEPHLALPELSPENPPKTGSPAALPRQASSTLISAQRAFEECVGAICLVEVTLHSLEFQEIATPEQEVLKRALKAIWCVHDSIDGLKFDDVIGGSTDREHAS